MNKHDNTYVNAIDFLFDTMLLYLRFGVPVIVLLNKFERYQTFKS